jgi:hypothetical protein
MWEYVTGAVVCVLSFAHTVSFIAYYTRNIMGETSKFPQQVSETMDAYKQLATCALHSTFVQALTQVFLDLEDVQPVDSR